ncbi:succinate dehydrogenase [ubiquinone] cytochrome b small subunit, mitochondrial-like [Melitaea cinxia]|uniref:succinate dehydrogenase [ubiquinone] cytochrome b small subunit, mitochondrial-like n=1 Tax=Melitaea cinxia TaxID=113334 RepID=UPI001E274249|nr:succinate dehydrogenase [ubiquinone] cytochrome b small subunit, mitochondrial-like [Melitaea cinxia]
MAFSMFLRTPACTSRLLSQHMMRLGTQPALKPIETHRTIATINSLKNTLLKTETTPILNSVRSFRTSAVRLASEKGSDHSKLWVVERVTSAILIPLIPLALLSPNKVLDSLLAITITAHSFWGLEAIAVDYVRASIFGPVIPKIAIGLVYLISIATLGGLFYVITHDIGIANSIKQFWAIKAGQKE